MPGGAGGGAGVDTASALLEHVIGGAGARNPPPLRATRYAPSVIVLRSARYRPAWSLPRVTFSPPLPRSRSPSPRRSGRGGAAQRGHLADRLGVVAGRYAATPRYAVSGTDVGYAATPRYAVSGTDVGYAATPRYALT
eukprot:411577-Rhodomonas_salina.2